ncbi:MAG: hypothetical protein M3O23_03090 [Actinomycetota bacterium]|nr:hypothetical protein [Actinomycetota bacterium]
MGRPRRLSTTTDDSELAVEYVKSRRAVRLLGSHRGEKLPPVEIPVDRLCQTLGIEPRQLGSPETYVLFAGVQGGAAGGLRDLVGTFANEDDGRQAFSRLRVQHPALRGWAELAAIDGFGRVRQICWFGLGSDRPVALDASGEVVPLGNPRRRRRRRAGTAAERPAGNVASF